MDLSRLPVWLLLVLMIVVAISIAVGAILLANRTMSEVGKEHNGTISPFITVVGLVYGALLGFTVVVAWQQFSLAYPLVRHRSESCSKDHDFRLHVHIVR